MLCIKVLRAVRCKFYFMWNIIAVASFLGFPRRRPPPVSDHFVKPESFLSSSQTSMTDFPTLPIAPTLAWKRYPFRVEPSRIDRIGHYRDHPRGLREVERCGITVETSLHFTWSSRVRVCASDPTLSSFLREVKRSKGRPVSGRWTSLQAMCTRWLRALHEIMKKHSCFRGFVNAVFANTLLSYDTCLWGRL